MKIRKDNGCFIGGENIDFKTQSKDLFAEQVLLIIISLAFAVFFIINPGFLHKSLNSGLIRKALGLFVFLVFSPFGAHLITNILTVIFKRLKCVTQN